MSGYDAEELALLLAGLDDADPDERGATAGLLFRQPTTDHRVRARLRQLLTDRSVVALPHPGVKGELRLLAGLALARAARQAGEDDTVRLRAAPAVHGNWVSLPERDLVLNGNTVVHELLEEPRDDVNALRTVLDSPTGDPAAVAELEASLDDRRVAALTIPYRFGELRVLAAAALAARRPGAVVLHDCPPLLSTDELVRLAEENGVATAGRSDAEVYTALRDNGFLPLIDLELNGPTALGWFGGP